MTKRHYLFLLLAMACLLFNGCTENEVAPPVQPTATPTAVVVADGAEERPIDFFAFLEGGQCRAQGTDADYPRGNGFALADRFAAHI